MTDLEIRNAVLAALEAGSEAPPSAIGVTAHKGIVTLSGRVGSFAEKAAAARAAIRTAGVQGLADELEVCGEQESACADEVIAARIVDLLRTGPTVDGVNVKVEVGHGWVHLSGVVDHAHQRALIESYARLSEGVLGVESRIRLRRVGVE